MNRAINRVYRENVFSEEELLKIQDRAKNLSKITENPYWVRLYDALHDAARHLELQQERVLIKE